MLEPGQLAALHVIEDRTGARISEQIRRAIDGYLETQGCRHSTARRPLPGGREMPAQKPTARDDDLRYLGDAMSDAMAEISRRCCARRSKPPKVAPFQVLPGWRDAGGGR